MIFARRAATDQPQVANAKPGFVDLSPVSPEPAAQVFAAWAAVLGGLNPPLIWETEHDREQEDL